MKAPGSLSLYIGLDENMGLACFLLVAAAAFVMMVVFITSAAASAASAASFSGRA